MNHPVVLDIRYVSVSICNDSVASGGLQIAPNSMISSVLIYVRLVTIWPLFSSLYPPLGPINLMG